MLCAVVLYPFVCVPLVRIPLRHGVLKSDVLIEWVLGIDAGVNDDMSGCWCRAVGLRSLLSSRILIRRRRWKDCSRCRPNCWTEPAWPALGLSVNSTWQWVLFYFSFLQYYDMFTIISLEAAGHLVIPCNLYLVTSGVPVSDVQAINRWCTKIKS